MAWNQPSDNGNDNNPFDKKKSRQPNKKTEQNGQDVLANLEEAFDKLTSKLKKKSGGNGGGSFGGDFLFNKKFLSWGALLIVIVWMLTGIYIVEAPERGVVLVLGKFKEETMAGPNWNWPFPIGKVEIVNVDQIRNAEIGYRSRSNLNDSMARSNVGVNSESLMLTKDENIVDVKIAVQYNVKSASDYLFNVRDPDNTLRHALESALREIVGQNVMDFLLTEGRNQIVAATLELGQSILDKYKTGLQISSVNLQDAQPPDQVQDAFDDVVKAREDKQRVINEAQAYANDIVPKARGTAARIMEEAIGYKESVIANASGEAQRFISILEEYKIAPKVTRERLYLDAIESVMSNTTKIMLGKENGNNLTLLPIDKLIQSSAAFQANQSQVGTVVDNNKFRGNQNSSTRTRSNR